MPPAPPPGGGTAILAPLDTSMDDAMPDVPLPPGPPKPPGPGPGKAPQVPTVP